MSAYDEALDALGDDGDHYIRAVAELTNHLASEDAAFLRELAEKRKALGYRQEDVAAAWGRHKTTVSQFERPGHDPRLSTVRRYAATIGVRYEHHLEFDSGVHGDTLSLQVTWHKPAPARSTSAKPKWHLTPVKDDQCIS